MISFSPDGSGILFPASSAGKRYNGQQETAPKNSVTHKLSNFVT